MYPVSLGFQEAESRINALMTNGHNAEALITSVFTFEKTLRRTLRFCAVSRGFTSKQTEILFNGLCFENMKKIWPCFDKQNRSLSDFIGNAKWQYVPPAVTMRNKLAHGERVYKLAECKLAAERVLEALNEFRTKLKVEIQFDGWSRMPVRKKAALQWLPILRSPASKSVEAAPCPSAEVQPNTQKKRG
jgi:hypothetical protein